MLQFYTDFSEYTTGVQPSDWSTRWLATNSTWQVAEKIPSTGGKVLEHTATATARRALIWDDVGLPTDCDIKASIKTDTKSTLQNGIGVRISGVAQFAESGYFIQLASRTQLGYDILFGKYVAGAFTELGNSGQTFNWSANSYVYLRLQAIGTTIKAKYWFDGDTEPSSFQFSVTDTSLTSGGTGVIANTLTGIRDYDQFWAEIIPKDIAALTSSASDIAGSQQVEKALYGEIDSTSDISATSKVNRILSGVIDGISETSGFLVRDAKLAQITDASSSVDAILKTMIALFGNISGNSDVLGNIFMNWGLKGLIECQSVIDGNSNVLWNLKGIITEVGSVNEIMIIYRATQLTGSAITIININANTNTTIELGGRF